MYDCIVKHWWSLQQLLSLLFGKAKWTKWIIVVDPEAEGGNKRGQSFANWSGKNVISIVERRQSFQIPGPTFKPVTENECTWSAHYVGMVHMTVFKRNIMLFSSIASYTSYTMLALNCKVPKLAQKDILLPSLPYTGTTWAASRKIPASLL